MLHVCAHGATCLLAQAYTRGLYIEDKIDLLMGYLVVNPLASLVGKVFGYKAKQKTKKYSPLTSSNQHVAVADLSRGEGEHTLEAARRAGLEHPNAKVQAVPCLPTPNTAVRVLLQYAHIVML